MSEYQYYEFQAIDRRLTEREMAQLRQLSTRAEITPTNFTNEYHWGDFRGNPRRMMEKYFDAFLYYANWGTHWLMFRIPWTSAAATAVRRYCAAESLSCWKKGKSLVIEFHCEDEEGDWSGEPDWLAGLTPLRSDLLAGDYRSLYLGWLACVQAGELNEDDLEPPVPAGLRHLSGSLSTLADFLRIDGKLLVTAVKYAKTGRSKEPRRADLSEWIGRLPESEKNALLLRVAGGEGALVQQRLQQRFRQAHAKANPPKSRGKPMPHRTVGEILCASGRHLSD